MQVVHVLNCGTVSGPEMLVLPELVNFPCNTVVWNLSEKRMKPGFDPLARLCATLKVPVLSFEISSRFDVSAILNLARTLETLPDGAIVHTHDVKASIYVWLASFLAKRRKLHFVATHHGAMARPNRISRMYERLFVSLASHCVDLFLCVSESEYDLLTSRGFRASILRLHRNGIERPLLKWSERRALAKAEKLKLLMVARLSPEKNHARALAVLQKFNSLFEGQWSLDIFGNGALFDELQNSVHSAGLHRKVFFRGYLQEAWREFDSYDCLLMFSTGEAMPITLLEAGWRCTPVFSSAVGGIPEVCGPEGGRLFHLAESDDSIAQKLRDFVSSKELVRRTAEHLQERVTTHFSGNRWRNELLTHYNGLLGADR
ncbi:MAG: hypothetical protein RI953_3019 [Pseudomonadota bacterium]|jgi:glycosyltransferase involved in cell wall biosynthesis